MSDRPWLLKEARPADMALVYDSWLRSYADSSFANDIDTDSYYTNQKNVIAQLLQRSTVIVAADPEDDDHVFGWACIEPIGSTHIIHYVFVKQAMRGMGLARSMVQAMIPDTKSYTVFASHRPRDRRSNGEQRNRSFKAFLRDEYNVRYDPFLALRRENT